MRSLRVLVVSSDLYPPTRVDVTVLFAQELSARGHVFDWILQSEKPCRKPYVVPWSNGQVWVGPTDLGTSLFSRLRKHIAGISHDLKLFQLLRSGQYDVIEVKDKFVSGIFAALAAKLYRKRFVYWLSYPFPEEYLIRAREGLTKFPLLYRLRGHAFRFMLYRLLLPAADHVFVQSEQMRRDLTAEGIAPSKMTAVPMGIDGARFQAARPDVRRSVLPEGVPCVLYLGTLVKVRRLDFMVRVLARLKATLPEVRLYFVGKGEDEQDEALLRQEVRRLDVSDSVIFVGQLSQPDALRYVQEADVCVSPFFPTPILNSTSPTKLVEYMAMGKAVVANDHPEQRLVIEQSAGGYCVPWDEGAFADAIVRLLQAPDLARSMGERGRAYAMEHRTYPRLAAMVERQFLKVANGDL
jgi:glycosyltransferase involved in cell wall biosynthesis